MMIESWCLTGIKIGKELIHMMITSTMLCNYRLIQKIQTCLHRPPWIEVLKSGQFQQPKVRPTSVSLVISQELTASTSVTIMRDPILCREEMMVKLKCGIIRPNSAYIHSKMAIKIMYHLLHSIQIFLLFSLLERTMWSTFGTH